MIEHNNTKFIKVIGLNDVYLLNAEAHKVEGDVTASRGKYSIDVKSILGLLSIDLTRGVTITYPANAIEFDKFLLTFCEENV